MLKFQLTDLRVFCLAARKASFAAAAAELGMSPAYVSKRIALLERDLGVALFHRAARRVSVTEEGEHVYASAQRILEDVEQLGETVGGAGVEARGTLRVTTSFRLGRMHVGPILSLLARRHPGLDVSLDVVDRRVDLLSENVDLDVRVGEVDEAHLVAYRLAPSPRILCAAPAYLDARGTPQDIADLARHDCLVLRERHQAFGLWRLSGPGRTQGVKVTARLSSNNSEIVRGWAEDGHGILLQATWDLSEALRAGRLRHILPQWSQPLSIWAASTARLSQSAKVRAAVQFLRAQLAEGEFALPHPG